jgi:hypothetical protein
MSEHDLTALIPPASQAGARRGRRCPDEARLAAFVDGALADSARDVVADHLAGCEYCCGQVGFLARAAELGPPPPVPAALLARAQGERVSLVRHLRPAAAVAGTVTVVAALLLVVQRDRQWSLPTLAPDSGTTVLAPASTAAERTVRNGRNPADAPLIVRPAEGETVPRAALELRWQDAPEALFYTVQLVDVRGDVAWEGRTEGTSLAVPAAAALAPGDRYFAWVLAHLPSGATVRSPAVGFRLAPG